MHPYLLDVCVYYMYVYQIYSVYMQKAGLTAGTESFRVLSRYSIRLVREIPLSLSFSLSLSVSLSRKKTNSSEKLEEEEALLFCRIYNYVQLYISYTAVVLRNHSLTFIIFLHTTSTSAASINCQFIFINNELYTFRNISKRSCDQNYLGNRFMLNKSLEIKNIHFFYNIS